MVQSLMASKAGHESPGGVRAKRRLEEFDLS
jgi:hypothetical protein